MSTYKQEDTNNCIHTYYVPIELDTDETIFNGEYLKNNDGDLVYFGLQDIDGNYDNKLKNKNLSNCIKLKYFKDLKYITDNNFSITLEYVNDTIAKIFINKPLSPLTLNERYKFLYMFFVDEYNNEYNILYLVFYPKICSYKYIFNVYNFNCVATNVSFQFNKLYFVCNYNGTGGQIDIDLLKQVHYLDIDNTYLNKVILMVDTYNEDRFNIFKNNINSLIYTYYSDIYSNWYLYESGYTPKKLLETNYENIYSLCYGNKNTYGLFDYGNNIAYEHKDSNWNKNGLFYLCAIDEEKQQVIPIFRTLPNNINRSTYNEYTYTTYILK